MVRLVLGRRGRDPALADASLALAALVRRLLALGPDDAVSVSEIACGDPECGGAETVVLVMRAGEPTRALKLKKPMAAVTEADLRAAAGEEPRL